MSKHVSYRGMTIDMDSMRRENEKTTAIGNMRVNAKGDQIKGGIVTKTAEEIARENHRVKSAVVRTGLKGKQPVAEPLMDPQKLTKQQPKVAEKKTKVKEIELPSGDIIIESDEDES